MTYELEISEQLDSKLKRLSKRSRKGLEIIAKKVGQILEDPHHFKPLKGDMKGAHGVYIDRSFVLVYEINESSHVVRLLDLEHHDKVYC